MEPDYERMARDLYREACPWWLRVILRPWRGRLIAMAVASARRQEAEGSSGGS